jgi:LacI family transcriptional regulator
MVALRRHVLYSFRGYVSVNIHGLRDEVPVKATVIGVVLHYAVDYVREGIEGALSYIREQNTWHGRILTPTDIRPGGPSLATLDGLVGAFGTPEEVRVVQRLRIPTVNFSSNVTSPLPSVLTDNRAVGRIAARHLLDCGLSNFAYIASPSLLFSQHRGEGFAAALRSAGRDVTTFTLKDPRLSRLLAGLPKPTGVFANNDFAAQRFIALCKETGWRVPDDFAVLGVDNGFDSRMSDMEFSSIDPGAGRVGYEAAQLLERLLRGERAPSVPILVSPIGVVARSSTNILAIDDPDLVRVCRHIRDHACDGMRISDAIRDIGISRRTLEKRFRARFGRSLHTEVDRVRFDRARDLLATTSLRVSDIAGRCGFADYVRFAKLFRRRSDCSPSQYRAHYGKP